MENMMTVEEVMELTGNARTFIYNELRQGRYVGKCIIGKKRSTYLVSRYWLYSQVLFYPEWKIKEYHNSQRGKYWLAYDPNMKRKKESAGTDSKRVKLVSARFT